MHCYDISLKYSWKIIAISYNIARTVISNSKRINLLLIYPSIASYGGPDTCNNDKLSHLILNLY